MFVKPLTLLLVIFLNMFAAKISAENGSNVELSGELKMWYKVTLTFDGPSVDESESTFRNYRLDVTFTKGAKSYKVPGYFAADGNAAETSASSGNKWQVNFTPDEPGTWTYSVSFRQGPDIAISFLPAAGTPVAGVDGETGSFDVASGSFDEPGYYAKGKLNYVGEHYGQFAGNKEWHVKAGPGSPEDFFGYKDFDNTKDWETRTSSTQVQDVYLRNLNGEGLHYYTPHVADWKTGDPTWKGGKGKGIIGALNYMASIGINSLYMIPFTMGDDSDNTWPWTSRDQLMSYDVSKLAQWDIVFSHMDRVGISATYYLCESDNSIKYLDNGNMTLKYPVYYREIIARFGYHLGIRFNLGEELKLTGPQQAAASKYLKDLDPYNTIICGHSSHVRASQITVFEHLLGKTSYDGPNYQLHEADNKDHLDLIMWRDRSAAAGQKWIVANDESWGIDNSTGSKGEERMLTYAWRTYMAGAEGMFQYCAYGTPAIGDITMENFRLIENTQKIHIACKNLFLKPEINPFLPQMRNENALVGNPTSNDAPFCLAKKGEIYIVYRTSSTNQKPLNLTGYPGTFTVKWYDAKNGGNFQNGSVTAVSGGGSVNLGNPPTNATAPWAILVYKDEPCTDEKNITLSVAGFAGSTVSGAGKYCINTTASVTANIEADAEFVNWTENGDTVSTTNPYSFTVTADRALVANFIKSDVVTYTITTSGNPSTGGSTSGAKKYKQGESVTVSAIVEPCFVFLNWTENGNIVSANANYTFTATSDSDLQANFIAKEFNVIAEPTIGGKVTGQLTYVCGAVVNVTATPNPGYKFNGWYADNKLISAQPTDDINIESAFQLKAKFSLISAVTFIGGSTITYYAPDMNELTHDTAKNVSIGKTTTALVIDGRDNEVFWQNAPLFRGQTMGKGSAEEYVTTNLDAQLSWKATWDETALYAVLKAKDDVLVWNDANNIWNIDALEFYVTKDAIVYAETGNNLGRTTQSKVLWQNLYFGSPEGRNIMEFRGSDNTSLAGTKTPVAGTSAARTYDQATKTTTFEIRYEWSKILTGANAFTSVAENDRIRIAMMWNDNDNAAVNARDHKVFYVEKAEPNAALSHKDYAVVTLKNTVTVGVNEPQTYDKFMLYPNPASGTVMFSKAIDADFYNLAGQNVLSVKNSSIANISSLAKGIYQVKINKGSGYNLIVK